MKPIKQHDRSDCGPACLAAVTSHYGRRLSLAQLRQLSGTNQNGTTVLGLVQASTQLGFSAKAVKARPDHLLKAPLPAIAHVIVRERRLHYVVVLKVRKDRVMVMDPASGRFSTQRLLEFERQWTGVLILLAPGGAFERGDGRPGRMAWYLRLLKPHRPALIQALLGAILATLLALSGSFYLQKVVDAVIVESNVPLLNLLTVAMLAALGFQILLTFGQNLILVKTGLKLDLALILSYYRHLFTLPQPFFDGLRVGEMVSRINDAAKIRVFLSQQGASLIVSALTLVLAVLVTLAFSWMLALLALAFLTLYSLLFLFAMLHNNAISRRLLEQTADFEAQLVESLGMASTLRRFDRQWMAGMKAELHARARPHVLRPVRAPLCPVIVAKNPDCHGSSKSGPHGCHGDREHHHGRFRTRSAWTPVFSIASPPGSSTATSASSGDNLGDAHCRRANGQSTAFTC